MGEPIWGHVNRENWNAVLTINENWGALIVRGWRTPGEEGRMRKSRRKSLRASETTNEKTSTPVFFSKQKTCFELYFLPAGFVKSYAPGGGGFQTLPTKHAQTLQRNLPEMRSRNRQRNHERTVNETSHETSPRIFQPPLPWLSCVGFCVFVTSAREPTSMAKFESLLLNRRGLPSVHFGWYLQYI